MNPSNITSVFSRYFIIGFFLSPFFSLLVLWQTLSEDFPPNVLRYGNKDDIGLIAVAALVVALVLTVSRHQILDVMGGLIGGWLKLPLSPVIERLLARERRRHDKIAGRIEELEKEARKATQRLEALGSGDATSAQRPEASFIEHFVRATLNEYRVELGVLQYRLARYFPSRPDRRSTQRGRYQGAPRAPLL